VGVGCVNSGQSVSRTQYAALCLWDVPIFLPADPDLFNICDDVVRIFSQFLYGVFGSVDY